MRLQILLMALLLFAGLAYAEADAGVGDTTSSETSTTTPATEEEYEDATLEDLQNAATEAAVQARELLEDMGVYNSHTCEPNGVFDLMIPAAIVLLIIGSGIAIFYMAGNFVNSPQLVAMSKQELYELIQTALIVVLFWAFLSFAQSTMGVVGTGPEDIFDRATEYSMVMVQKITKDMFWLSAFNTLIYMIYNAPLRWGGALHMAIHFNLGGALKPVVDGVGTMASLLSFALGEWTINVIVLCFIKRYMLTLFLPIGIILKSFPQTRGAGNALLALSIAFFLVYPVMLAINYEAYSLRYGQLADISGVESVVGGFLTSSGLGATALYALFMKGLLKTLPGLIAISIATTAFLDMYTDVIYTVFVLSIFLPLLNIFVTFTFAREIAKYFGTEINIAAFVKMI